MDGYKMDSYINFTEEEKIILKEIIEEVEKLYNLKINYTVLEGVNNISDITFLDVPPEVKLVIEIMIFERVLEKRLQQVDHMNATEVFLYDSNNYELLKKYIKEFEVFNMIKIKHERVGDKVYIESEFGDSIKDLFENALLDKRVLEIELEENLIVSRDFADIKVAK